jgi:tyrosinase
MDGQAASPANGYNPRCVVRDLTSYSTTTWMTYENLRNLTYGPGAADIAVWQDELQGRGFGGGFMGVHAAGHYAMGGNAADLWSSNNDPAFYLHHAMVDRLWSGWQYLYARERAGGDGRGDKVAGTMTINNMPPSREGTLEDTVDLLGLGERWGKVKVGDLMDPMGKIVCYYYA